jgi:hypothetical protein
MVAQSRDRKNRVTAIDLQSLDQCFTRLSDFARRTGASVHLPRIGHATPGFNWYGTERLIRKRLSQQGIPASVYYFARHGRQQLELASPQAAGTPSKSAPVTPSPVQTTLQSLPREELPDVFSGNTILFYDLPEDQSKR